AATLAVAGRSQNFEFAGTADALFSPVSRQRFISADWPVVDGDPGGANRRSEMIGDTADWSIAGLTDPFLAPGTVDSPLQDLIGRWTAQTALVQYSNGRPATPAARPIAAGKM